MTTANETHSNAAARETDEPARLQRLVGELLAANQELRFKLAQAEQRATHGARQFADAAVVYGLLVP
jgi:hypothetical protein